MPGVAQPAQGQNQAHAPDQVVSFSPMTRSIFFTMLVCAAGLAAATQPSAAARMLERAIAAAGGTQALEAATVLKWTAKATIHSARGPLHIEGRWLIEPPDRAVVATWESDKGESSVRRMLLDGAQGWMERGTERTPMPAAILANERDQFYLYSVMRLVPLRDREIELSADNAGTLLIRHPKRPDVEAFFDETGRLARLRTYVSHPANNSDIVQEVILEGAISAGGVQWPRTIRIVQDGKPFFEMQLIDFSLGSNEELRKALSASPSSGAARQAS
jgi:hypothetical protein